MSISATPDLDRANGFSVNGRPTVACRPLRQLAPLALFLALAASAATARTYTLATTADDAVVNGNCTLREALRAARDNAAVDACLAGEAADTIVLPVGTYPFSGQELFNLESTLEIRGQGSDPSAVTVDLQGASRFLYLQGNGASAALVLRGFTVVGGNSGAAPGGAVNANQYAVTLDRMRFVGNHSGDLGGAVYFYNSLNGGSLVVSRTAFLANSAVGRGGGMWVSTRYRVDLRDVVFQLNSVVSGGTYGDAWGGGVFVETFPPTGVATLHRCDFSQNSANATGSASGNSVFGGGARLSSAGGVIEVTDSTFVGNSASVTTIATGQIQIAAIAANAYNGGSVRLDRILVDLSAVAFPNWARDVDLFAFEASVVLANAQVTSGLGSGIEASASGGGLVEVVAATAADYPGGAGITLDSRLGGTVALRNSLLALNGDDLETFGHGIFLVDNCMEPTPGEFPGFVDAPGGDFRLRPTSAAVDAALPEAIAGPFDRDHAPRLIGVAPDCGAYETGGLFADGFEAGDTGIWGATTGG
jgi:CSLREA domain-containing protein